MKTINKDTTTEESKKQYLAEHCTSSCRRDGCPHEEQWEESQMKVVKISWVDSGTSEAIWESKDDYTSEYGLCESVGYLLSKTKDRVVICQSTSDTQYGQTFVIPTKSITRIESL